MKFEINNSTFVHLYLHNGYYGISKYYNDELKESKKLSSIEQGLQIIEELISINN